MYNDYYNLREDPFNITPDPKFLYLTGQHREALNHMLYGITQRKGFVCLTGAVGSGKTMLCRELLSQIAAGENAARFHTALILNPMLSQTQLLRAIVEEFGIVSKRRDRLGYLDLLNAFLLEINSKGQDAILIVDEAQDMPDATLEMTRLLSNLETHSQKLLQIVLVGQEELRDKLAKPSLRQLAQRITVRYHLGPLSAHEVEAYLRHRLAVAATQNAPRTGDDHGTNNHTDIDTISIAAAGQPAVPAPAEPSAAGSDALRFDASAVRAIYEYSQGTPRLVNALGDKALLAGYVYRTNCIDANLVRLAVDELKEAC
jgi:general secretion pathway protein A